MRNALIIPHILQYAVSDTQYAIDGLYQTPESIQFYEPFVAPNFKDHNCHYIALWSKVPECSRLIHVNAILTRPDGTVEVIFGNSFLIKKFVPTETGRVKSADRYYYLPLSALGATEIKAGLLVRTNTEKKTTAS